MPRTPQANTSDHFRALHQPFYIEGQSIGPDSYTGNDRNSEQLSPIGTCKFDEVPCPAT